MRLFSLSLVMGVLACTSKPPSQTANSVASLPSTLKHETCPTEHPIAVPLMGIACDALSTEAVQAWVLTGEAVYIDPPPQPPTTDEATVEAWVRGPYLQWLTQKRDAVLQIEAVLKSMAHHPKHERGFAAGLFAHAYEDLIAKARSAAIPDHIAQDPELLAIYHQSLLEVLEPFYERSTEGYALCAFLLKDEPATWDDWKQYCEQSALRMQQTSGINPHESDLIAIGLHPRHAL